MSRAPRSTIWVTWFAANALPSIVVSALLLGLRNALGVKHVAAIGYVVLFGLVIGLQSILWARWRRRFYVSDQVRARTWVAWTLAGLMLAMVCAVGALAVLDGSADERVVSSIGWLVGGLALGFAQANVLGPPRKQAFWWILASMLGWACADALIRRAGAIPFAAAPAFRWLIGGLVVPGNNEIWAIAITLAIYGVFTGAVMARLTPASA